MKKRFYLLCVIAGLLFILSKAQAQKNNTIGLDWGYGHLARQNLSFSTLINKGSSPINIQLSYLHTGKWNHSVNSRFSLYKTMENEPYIFYWDTFDHEYETFPNQYVFLDINYKISRSIITTPKWDVQLGARERNRFQLADYAHGFVTNFSYFFLFGVDAHIGTDYSIDEKQNFGINIYLPLFSHESRPPWASQDGEYFYNSRSHKPIPTVVEYIKRGSFSSWNRTQIFDIDIDYEYQINDSWSFGTKYLLSMNFSQEPRPLSSIDHVFYLTSKYHF